MLSYNITDSTDKDAAAEQKIRDIIFFCETPKGSLPQMRDYGLDYTNIDENFALFRRNATVDIIRGLRKHLSINVKNIDLTQNLEGVTTLNLEL